MKLKSPLTGLRLILRDYAPEDLPFCADMWFHPENGRYLSDPDRAHVDEAFRKVLDGLQDSPDGYYLIAELRSSGERIGTCCAFPEADVYDIGYCVHRERWRQGYGIEIVGLLTAWVQKQGGAAVTAEAAKDNRASCSLLEKCGFRAVRTASFRKYHMDVQFDSVIYRKALE